MGDKKLRVRRYLRCLYVCTYPGGWSARIGRLRLRAGRDHVDLSWWLGRTGLPLCACGQKINPDVCWCGNYIHANGTLAGHDPDLEHQGIPVGCICRSESDVVDHIRARILTLEWLLDEARASEKDIEGKVRPKYLGGLGLNP